MSINCSNITPKIYPRNPHSYHLTNLPSLLPKTNSSLNPQDSFDLKQLLIEKYTQKFTNIPKSQAFLVKKAIEETLNKQKIPLKTLQKLRTSLNDAKKSEMFTTHIQPDDPLQPEQTHCNPQSSQDFKKNILKNEESSNKPNKKLLAEIVPGYCYRKEYYDFDEISVEESEKSVKSIYKFQNNLDEWAWIIKNDSENYKAQIQKKNEGVKKQQQKLKEELDKQIQMKNIRKENEKQQELIYHEKMMEQMKKDESHDKDKYEKAANLQQKAFEELNKQTENFEKLQSIEKKIERKFKDLLNKKIEKETTEDNSKAYLKKKENLMRNQQMMFESTENRKKLLQRSLQEKEEDVKMQEAYMKDVEKMLVEREVQKRIRFEEIQKKYGNFYESLQGYDKRKIDTFLKTNTYKYNIIPDSKEEVQLYNVNSFPTHLIIDKNSIISYYVSGLGPTTINDLDNTIDSLIK